MAPPLSHHAEPAERLVGSDRVLALLGDEFLRLAFTYQDARPEAARIVPALRALADRFGETAHYAILDGADVVYRAKVDPPAGEVRLTSTVGGRNPARATAVGKVLLAHLLTDDADVAAWARLHPLAPRTPRTLTDDNAFVAEVARARVLGYAVDNQENEAGSTASPFAWVLRTPKVPSACPDSRTARRCAYLRRRSTKSARLFPRPTEKGDPH